MNLTNKRRMEGEGEGLVCDTDFINSKQFRYVIGIRIVLRNRIWGGITKNKIIKIQEASLFPCVPVFICTKIYDVSSLGCVSSINCSGMHPIVELIVESPHLPHSVFTLTVSHHHCCR